MKKPAAETAEKPGKIIPPEAAPLRTLTATMAVMCYLACLAIGALVLINRAVDSWTHGLAREVTVQIRETEGSAMEVKLATAQTLIEATPGVVSADILPRAAGIKLLEPWLGSSGYDDLPVPRLLRVTINDSKAPDFVALEAKLKANVEGAFLDTHKRWAAELTRMANMLSTISWLILILISGSAIAMVSFATHAVLDANQRIVDVLHLVGARDGFIARQIDRRFIVTGSWAGCIGLLLAIATFFVLSLTGQPASNAIAAASQSLIHAPDGSAWRSSLAILAVPPSAILIALMTSRITLMHMLRAAR